MPDLPIEIIVLMQPFTPVFTERTWDWVQVLVVGAILAPGKRTVTSVLRVMSMSDESQFQRYHRVLKPDMRLFLLMFCMVSWAFYAMPPQMDKVEIKRSSTITKVALISCIAGSKSTVPSTPILPWKQRVFTASCLLKQCTNAVMLSASLIRHVLKPMGIVGCSAIKPTSLMQP